MIRVLHFISDANIGGAGRLLIHCLKNFDPTVFDVSVVVPKGSALVPLIEETGKNVIECEFGRDKSHEKGALAAYKKIIREVKPHIVHTHSAFDAKLAAYLCGVKSRIYTRHSVFDPPKKLTTFPGKQIAGLVNNTLATRIIAVADAAAENLTATGVRSDKITVILNGVEALRRTTLEEQLTLRASLGFSETDFVAGISARFEPYKGHSYLIESAKRVCAENPNVKFLLMGQGSTYEETVAAVKDAGLTDSVRFTGFVSDVVPYYNILNLSLNCSWGTEATSLALAEAMSLSLPTVATRFGGNPCTIKDGVNGLLTPINDADAMADAILKLASDKALYDSLSEGAARLFKENFTAAAMTRKIEAVYLEEAKRCGFGA